MNKSIETKSNYTCSYELC